MKLRIMERLKHLLTPDHFSFLLLSVTLALQLWIPSLVFCSFTFIYDLLEEKIGFFRLIPDHISTLLLLVTLALQLWIPSLILYAFTVIYDFLEDEVDFLKKLKTSVNED